MPFCQSKIRNKNYIGLPNCSPIVYPTSTCGCLFVGYGIIGKDGVTSSLHIRVTLTGTNQWRTHYTLYRKYDKKLSVLYFDLIFNMYFITYNVSKMYYKTIMFCYFSYIFFFILI